MCEKEKGRGRMGCYGGRGGGLGAIYAVAASTKAVCGSPFGHVPDSPFPIIPSLSRLL